MGSGAKEFRNGPTQANERLEWATSQFPEQTVTASEVEPPFGFRRRKQSVATLRARIASC